MTTKTLSTLFIALSMLSNGVQAIGIDNMIKLGKDNEASFTVSNSDGYRQYISVAVSEIDVVNGELKTIPYNRDNIEQWEIEVSPTRSVIDNMSQKYFKVKHLADEEDKNSDSVYQVTFVPTPYFPEGRNSEHAVQVAIGFAPIVIFPAQNDQKPAYVIHRESDKVTITNNGGSYLNIIMDACDITATRNERANCSKVVHALSGRKLAVTLPSGMNLKNAFNVSVATHNSKFKDEFSLKLNEKVTK